MTPPFDPDKFLEISNKIANVVKSGGDIHVDRSDEAWCRTATSRAYYSAFLVLREYMLTKSHLSSLIKGDPYDHGRIISTLKNLPGHLIQHYNDLQNLRESRDQADYELCPEEPIDENLVEMLNLQAKGIIDNAKKIIGAIRSK